MNRYISGSASNLPPCKNSTLHQHSSLIARLIARSMKLTVSALVAVVSALLVSVGPVSAVVWAEYCSGGSNRDGQYVCFHSPNDIHKALLGSSGFNGAFSPDNKSELTPKPTTYKAVNIQPTVNVRRTVHEQTLSCSRALCRRHLSSSATLASPSLSTVTTSAAGWMCKMLKADPLSTTIERFANPEAKP